MKILSLNLQGTGIGYFRHWLPAKALEAKGHEVIYFPDTDNAIGFVEQSTKHSMEQWLLNMLPKIDVIHMGYSTSEPTIRLFACAREYARRALNRNIPLITDIDDDILNVPAYNAGFSSYHGGSEERRYTRFQLQISDAVTVTTPALAESLKKYCKKTYVLPNCFSTVPWDGLPSDPNRANDNSVRLMFAGGRSRVADLDTIQRPLEQLMEAYSGVGTPTLRLFFLGCTPKWATQWMPSPNNPMLNRDYKLQDCMLQSYWTTIKWIAPDILVNPVVPNTFNKSKSHIKAYDAVLGNAAFVGTDWATHDPIPEDVMYKCVSPTQWFETLSHLIENKEARKRKAQALKAWALENQAIEHHISSWEEVYSECISKPVVATLEDTAGGA